jgi:hypothetical protein
MVRTPWSRGTSTGFVCPSGTHPPSPGLPGAPYLLDAPQRHPVGETVIVISNDRIVRVGRDRRGTHAGHIDCWAQRNGAS